MGALPDEGILGERAAAEEKVPHVKLGASKLGGRFARTENGFGSVRSMICIWHQRFLACEW